MDQGRPITIGVEGLPWWRGAAIYQIYPRSFADTTGDGVGDLPGITAHLEHVASLGVDGVWLSPFFTSPMKDYGYDVADYCDVDPMFGTLADFDRLVARAHGLGLRVIIDQVLSHTSDQHPWFRESRSTRENAWANWYVWADPKPDGTPPSNWQSVFGGPAWTWDARRGQYYLHNFLTEQPDLNLHDRAVQDALLEGCQFWLDRGVDGFRLDALNFAMHDPALTDNPPAPASDVPRSRPWDYQLPIHNMAHGDIPLFLERIRRLTDGYPGVFTVAEVVGEGAAPTMALYTQAQTRLHTAYGFDFLYAAELKPSVVARAVGGWPDAAGGWPSWAFSNHDAPRAVSRWAPAEDRAACARLLMLLLVCLRGNLFIYQGEELGLPQAQVPFERLRDPEAIANWPLTLGRDGARTPMPWRAHAPGAGFTTGDPWLPIPAAHLALAADRQDEDAGSQLSLTRALLHLRRSQPILRLGGLRVLEANDSNGLLVIERAYAGERLTCAFNLGPGCVPWRVDGPTGWRTLQTVGEIAYDALGPYAGVILRAVSTDP